LINANFKVSISELSDEQFANYASQALWIEQYRADKMQAAVMKAVSNLFGNQS
jgi:hypothetical protein